MLSTAPERRTRSDAVDPSTEGARYSLAPALSSSIWDRACMDTTDGMGRSDVGQALARFHQLAARMAVRGPGRHVDVGRVTRVGASSTHERAAGAPGRETLVVAEARRWSDMTDGQAHPVDADGSVRSATVQMKRDQASTSSETVEPTDAVVEHPGGGHPLPEDLRRRMERVFGADLSAVRIHSRTEVEAVGALAYTRGIDIYFAPGRYEPESRRGQVLIGHELAHVVQQSRGRVTATTHSSGLDINDDQALEREADELGAKAAEVDAHEASLGVDVQTPAAPHGSVDRRRDDLPRTLSISASSTKVTQLQPDSAASSKAELPPGTTTVRRAQVLAELLDEWRAAGLLDPPARPVNVAAFPSISPPQIGPIHAAGSKGPVVAGAAPALRLLPEGPVSVRPTLRLIPGGGGSPAPTPEAPPLLPPALLGAAVFLVVLLWPSETAPRWMDELNPITGAPYGSPDEYEWTRRLSDPQQDYLRRLLRARETMGPATTSHPDPGSAADPGPVPILDTNDDQRRSNLPNLEFYHGTDESTARSMAAGVPITASGHGEFGAGFYTFLNDAAAEEAAAIYTRNRDRGFHAWGVVDFSVPAKTVAQFFEVSTVAALMQGRFSRILVFSDRTTPVAVAHPPELGGMELHLSWAEFVETNARAGKNLAWPYDLVIGPLKGKLRSQKRGIDQWVFGSDGVVMFNSPAVKRKVSASGAL
jgi:hypothetical protein